MNWNDIKKALRKTWWFIWESNSIWSWIVCIILAFIIIKFLVYPGLGLIFGTSYPIVAVVSESMEHDMEFEQWWNSKAICTDHQCPQEEFYKNYGISKQDFLNFKFKNGFNKGDIIFLFGTKPENLKIGDVLVFQAGKPDPIIHRIIEINKQDSSFVFKTKGDHNLRLVKEPWLDETNIKQSQIIGKGVFRIPYLGWVKIWFVELINIFR